MICREKLTSGSLFVSSALCRSGKWVCDECTRDGVVAEELERKEIERQREKEQEWEQQSRNHPPSLPIAAADIKQGRSHVSLSLSLLPSPCLYASKLLIKTRG